MRSERLTEARPRQSHRVLINQPESGDVVGKSTPSGWMAKLLAFTLPNLRVLNLFRFFVRAQETSSEHMAHN